MQTEIRIQRWDHDQSRESMDTVVVEEPLEIRINGDPITVTMRTPGEDFALAVGLLLAEGILRSANEILSMAYCTDNDNPDLRNILNVYLPSEWKTQNDGSRWQRSFSSTSSCGLCGKQSIESVRVLAAPIEAPRLRVQASTMSHLGDKMREAQQIFSRTGGLHAAALFLPDGELVTLSEDIGRHNAVDKLIGGQALAGKLPLDDRILMVSGRTSFEILQKAAVARIPFLCSVSAPSSLAVALARDLNMTLIGFLRGKTMNVYAGEERVACG